MRILYALLYPPYALLNFKVYSAANFRQDAVEHPNRQRRTHALLGMSVLRKLPLVRYSIFEFFVDPKEYRLANWREISSETEKLLEQIKLPVCFDDWEEDDKLGCDDADDFEYDEDE